MREPFEWIHSRLVAASPTARGELTTIYVKYASDETAGRPFAVVWIKKSSELVVGLSLPENIRPGWCGEAPRGYKYSGLTGYLTVHVGDTFPEDFESFVRLAYNNMVKSR